ncbi:class I SAM-dependent methyltransferase [Krasilnikovia sp. M28-CT-15]|uniref:class I SAM-dependent methyltransferase n=1 Tax=Krasilnikovia sp. M28-CT-15 TaxID=3373540 RepID=UPI0038763E08
MSRLVRFCRGQVTRLHSLTSRQGLALIAIALLCVGTAAVSVTGQQAAATTLLAGLLGIALLGLLLVARRLGALRRGHHAHLAALRDMRVLVEETQRRVVAAVERERIAAADRHRDMMARLIRDDRDTQEVTRLLLREQSREAEAALQVFRQVTPRAPMPFAAGDDRGAADLLGLLHVVRGRRPALTVTLGADSAAVWLAYAVEATGGRVIAVEHDRDRVGRLRALLAAHGLARVAEVVHAPLSDARRGSDAADWYEWTALEELREIDLLVVDGPADLTTRQRVTAAVRALGPRLAADAVLVVENDPAAHAGLRASPLDVALTGRYTALAYGSAATAGAEGSGGAPPVMSGRSPGSLTEESV